MMTNDGGTKIAVGSCSNCGRVLRVKSHGIRQNMRLTCKCGHINTLDIDQETLSKYGVIRTTVKEDIYQTKSVPLYRLLDGPRLRAMWAEAEAEQAKRIEKDKEMYFKDKNMPEDLLAKLSALPDLISVAINPYASERSAREAMVVLVNRVKAMYKARPWSIELFENVECAIMGLLDAPFFIFLGMTGYEAYEKFKEIVRDLRSDHPRIGAGAEWEIWGQNQANQWRNDRCAMLIERWVLLDENDIHTFGVNDFMEYTPLSDDRLMDLLIKTTKGMIWQCPKCQGILGKELTPQLVTLFGAIAGFNTCTACKTSYMASEVYGGKFDVSISDLLQILGNEVIKKGTNLLISHLGKIDNESRRTEIAFALGKIGGCSSIDTSLTTSISRAITTSSKKPPDCARHPEIRLDAHQDKVERSGAVFRCPACKKMRPVEENTCPHCGEM